MEFDIELQPLYLGAGENTSLVKYGPDTEIMTLINTFRTCDADLRFYITTVQDG